MAKPPQELSEGLVIGLQVRRLDCCNNPQLKALVESLRPGGEGVSHQRPPAQRLRPWHGSAMAGGQGDMESA